MTPADALPALDDDFLVDAATIASFRENGHTLVRGLAAPDEVAAYRESIEATALRYSRENRPIEERDTYGKAFLQITNLFRVDEASQRFVCSRRFAGVAGQLLGVDGIRLYHDQALFKEPGGGRTPWHQDQIYWPLSGTQTVTIWMPLVDVPAEVGSMTFGSGTHHMGFLGDAVISDESDLMFETQVQERQIPLATHGAMTAGDATFHAGWTLHKAPPNPTGQMRSVMTMIYMADGLTLLEPVRTQADEYRDFFPGLAPGDLAASELNPLLWQKSG